MGFRELVRDVNKLAGEHQETRQFVQQVGAVHNNLATQVREFIGRGFFKRWRWIIFGK